MNYQKIIVVGNATKDAEQLTSRDGETKFTYVHVGVSDAKGQTTFFPITVFGKQSQAVAKYVVKGRCVVVDGRIQVNDKGRFQVIADRVQFGPESTSSDEDR